VTPHKLPTKADIEAIGETDPSPEYAAARATTLAYWEGRFAGWEFRRRALNHSKDRTDGILTHLERDQLCGSAMT
jgi:hypothetical protein